MNVYAISDLHLSSDESKPMDIFGAVWDNYWQLICEDWESKVKEEDIVLIAGDISWAMRLDGAIGDLERIAALKGTKIMIRGNHDYWWESISKIRAVLPPSILCIQNDAVRIGEFVLCGTRGWTVPETGMKPTEEDLKLYEREKLRLEMSLKAATAIRQEGDKLIVMIHYPPFNSRLEDSDLSRMMEQYKANAVVYGHLHGVGSRVCLKIDKRGLPFYLTSCDLVENKLVKIF
ncbi:MAG: metallophosphoesterase [Clostridia bacterium]|nr:metallophosphoesterase [Clostridia bacterium]